MDFLLSRPSKFCEEKFIPNDDVKYIVNKITN